MPEHVVVPQPKVTKESFFREAARVIVIDDKCGGPTDPGSMSQVMCASWAKSSSLFHVKGINGFTTEEKIEDFKTKLLKVVGLDSKNIIFVLDRDLGIGKLPLSDDAKKSGAATIDDYNDGPALVPHLRAWFDNAPIIGFTGEGDLSGMSEVYGGAPVVQKPDYANLKENLVEAFAHAYMERFSLREASFQARGQE